MCDLPPLTRTVKSYVRVRKGACRTQGSNVPSSPLLKHTCATLRAISCYSQLADTSPTNYNTNGRIFTIIDCRMSSSRPRTTSFVDANKSNNPNFGGMKISSKDGSKVSGCYLFLSQPPGCTMFILRTYGSYRALAL